MSLEARPRTLEIYEREDGSRPYTEWLKSIRDKRTLNRIDQRVRRIEQGNFGDHKSVKGAPGIWELRLFWGPGYRVYIAEDGDTIVILLCGGDKSSQDEDIERAKEHWTDYKESTQ